MGVRSQLRRNKHPPQFVELHLLRARHVEPKQRLDAGLHRISFAQRRLEMLPLFDWVAMKTRIERRRDDQSIVVLADKRVAQLHREARSPLCIDLMLVDATKHVIPTLVVPSRSSRHRTPMYTPSKDFDPPISTFYHHSKIGRVNESVKKASTGLLQSDGCKLDAAAKSAKIWSVHSATATEAKSVRLRIDYRSPEALLREMTKCVGRGGIRIETRQPVEIGTRFIFELWAEGLEKPVEVLGTVMLANPKADGASTVHVRYEPPADRQGLEALLTLAEKEAAVDARRKEVRIPLSFRAVESPDAPGYRMKNISKGGLCISTDDAEMPPHVQPGAAFKIHMKLTTGMLSLGGTIVWVSTLLTPAPVPCFGVKFDAIKPKVAELLNSLLALKVMPSPPWIARIEIGDAALTSTHA